jgi:hypothetical protein
LSASCLFQQLVVMLEGAVFGGQRHQLQRPEQDLPEMD